MTKKNTRARGKTQASRTRKKRPIRNSVRSAFRWSARVQWIALTLCAAAVIALVVVEASVAGVIHRMTQDPITRVIFVSSAVLASLGVVLGPMAIRSIPTRAHGQRKFAWRVVAACFVLSAWNLSTVMANAQAQMTADAVRNAPGFEDSQVRLVSLNRRIDALADETSFDRRADDTRMNLIAERDRLDERLEGANPRPVLFAWANGGWVFWAKAILFHALVAGFATAFALAMKPKTRRSSQGQKKRPARAAEDGNVVAFSQF